MSVLDRGLVHNTSASMNARGGTELMRDRLLMNVDPHLLRDVVIYFSRVDQIRSPEYPQIYYAHDLPEDSSLISVPGFFDTVDDIVFVSDYQKCRYEKHFNLSDKNLHVIRNAIEPFDPSKRRVSEGTKNIIYHTTPHRGLNLAYHVISQLAREGYDIHFDVYSSFSVYGWDKADLRFKELFDSIAGHPNMTYHGGVSNYEVRDALQKADFFFYPSIWEETSCLALIEASQAGVTSIIPASGVFLETVEGNYSFFEPGKNLEEHAYNSYIALKNLLDGDTPDRTTITKRHSIDTYASSWNCLLKEIISRRKSND